MTLFNSIRTAIVWHEREGSPHQTTAVARAIDRRVNEIYEECMKGEPNGMACLLQATSVVMAEIKEIAKP